MSSVGEKMTEDLASNILCKTSQGLFDALMPAVMTARLCVFRKVYTS